MSALEEINCATVLEAIKKEKQKLKTEIENQSNEFVEVNPSESAFWTDLFVNCFLCAPDDRNQKNTLTHDDMLFFVSKLNPEESTIEVYRKDSKKLPCLTDFNYDWEETVYLNLILHEIEYILTCAICIQTSTKDLEILKKHSKRVYSSPSKRDLKSKGTEETITYPNIYFTIDDFDEAFNEMVVKEGQMVCVELVANVGQKTRVLFLGSIKYEALKRVYDARASTGSKLVQRVSLGSIADKRIEFVRMKGPAAKGYAEMAVSRHDIRANFVSQSVPSTPVGDRSLADSVNVFKFTTGFRKPFASTGSNYPSANPSLASTPEIEVRDFRQDFMEHTNSFLRKTYNQALSIFKFNSQDETVTSEPGPTMTSTANAPGSSSEQALNAYLTYVSLPLNAIMQDILGEQQKSVLTF